MSLRMPPDHQLPEFHFGFLLAQWPQRLTPPSGLGYLPCDRTPSHPSPNLPLGARDTSPYRPKDGVL